MHQMINISSAIKFMLFMVVSIFRTILNCTQISSAVGSGGIRAILSGTCHGLWPVFVPELAINREYGKGGGARME